MANQAMAIANDHTLSELIDSAHDRLVYMAPGVSRTISKSIAGRFQHLRPDRILIILDVDSEACRLGYGDIESLEALEKVISQHGGMLLRQSGMRIGLVIADGQTMVFAPTAQLIEAAPQTDQLKPNAIRIGNIPPADIERELGLGADGIEAQKIGLDKATRSEIEQVKADLKANPPQRFDISRTVRVFNAQFEFVELSMRGAAIDRKSVSLPSSLLGLSSHQKTLETRLHLVDEQNTPSGRRLQKYKNSIMRHYLKHIPGYGFIVLRTDKEKFLNAIAKLEYLARKCQKRIRREVQRHLDRKRAELMKVLLPLVERDMAPTWTLLVPPGPQKYLEKELTRIIGRSEDLLKDIEVRVIFKAVTYESLVDPTFVQMVRDRVPQLKQLHEEFDAAMGQQPRLFPSMEEAT